MKNWLTHYRWWRALAWCVGGVIFSGQLIATSIRTTVTGGTPTSGYQGAAYTSFATGDVMRGFMMFKNGFTIPTGGPIFYDAEGPVFGDITFADNTAILQLGADLRLGTTGGFSGDGKIDGLGNAIFLGGDKTLTSALVLTSTLVIDGCGHTLTLGGGRFSLSNRATLTLRNMNLVLNNTSPFTTVSTTQQSYIGLENVNIYLQDNVYLFGNTDGDAALMTRISGFVGIHGAYSAIAKAAGGSARFDNPSANKTNIAINSGSTLYLGPGTTLNLTDLRVPSANKIGFQDASSVLWLDGASLTCANANAGERGLVLQKGLVLFDDKVLISDMNGGSANTDITQGLIFGDGTTSANDVDVRVLGGAYTVLTGCMQYNHS